MLINVSQLIKKTSLSPPQKQTTIESPEKITSRLGQLESVVRSSEIAKKSNLKSYLQERKKDKISESNATSNQLGYQISRYDSRTSQNDIRLSQNTTNSNVRGTNVSKLSAYSNLTKQTLKKNQKEASEVDPNSMEGKLASKM